jgi:hypothetical protein
MSFVKRFLLCAALGTSSLVLAGCYGMPAEDIPPLDEDPEVVTSEPIDGLETEPANGDTPAPVEEE